MQCLYALFVGFVFACCQVLFWFSWPGALQCDQGALHYMITWLACFGLIFAHALCDVFVWLTTALFVNCSCFPCNASEQSLVCSRWTPRHAWKSRPVWVWVSEVHVTLICLVGSAIRELLLFAKHLSGDGQQVPEGSLVWDLWCVVLVAGLWDQPVCVCSAL